MPYCCMRTVTAMNSFLFWMSPGQTLFGQPQLTVVQVFPMPFSFSSKILSLQHPWVHTKSRNKSLLLSLNVAAGCVLSKLRMLWPYVLLSFSVSSWHCMVHTWPNSRIHAFPILDELYGMPPSFDSSSGRETNGCTHVYRGYFNPLARRS